MIRPFLVPLLLGVLFGSIASADEIKVPLIGLGWEVRFIAPTLKREEMKYPAGSLQYSANAGRFNVTLFVEPPPKEATKATHAACRDFYWAQAKRNPAIVASSIKQGTSPTCEFVTYRTEGVFQDAPYVQDHVNCYFVHEGRWVDLHASIVTPTEDDSRSLAEFASHVAYGAWQASKGDPESFALDDLGKVTLSPPSGWLVGNLSKDKSGDRPTQHTLGFRSATDPNSYCLLTFFSAPSVPDTLEGLHEFVERNTARIAEASVEKKAVILDLKFAKGIGCAATLTDTGLVGKPKEPGNSKALASGFLVLKPGVLGVVSMFMDDAQGPDADMMLKAVETLTLE